MSDGHGNARIHCFGPDGVLKFSWGSRGHGPGEFDTVHSVFIDHDDGDTVYAADRFNDRVQFFRPDGTYLGEWADLRMPQSVRKGPDGAFYVAELPHRVTVLGRDGTLIARWGDGVEVDDADGGAGAALPDAPARRSVVPGRVRTDPGAGLFAHAPRHRGRLDRQLLRRRGGGVMGGARSRQPKHPEVRAPLGPSRAPIPGRSCNARLAQTTTLAPCRPTEVHGHDDDRMDQRDARGGGLRRRQRDPPVLRDPRAGPAARSCSTAASARARCSARCSRRWPPGTG